MVRMYFHTSISASRRGRYGLSNFVLKCGIHKSSRTGILRLYSRNHQKSPELPCKIRGAALQNSRGCPAIFLQTAIFPPRFLVPVRMAKVILTGLRPPPLPGRTAHLFVDALAQAHPDRTLSLYVSIYVSIYTHAQPLSSYLYRIYVSILSTYLYTFIPMYGCNIRQC